MAQFNISPSSNAGDTGYNSSSATIEITSSGHGGGDANSWELDMSTKPAWITVNPTEDTGTGSCSVGWSYNSGGERDATLLFELIGNPGTYNDTFQVDQDEYEATEFDADYGLKTVNSSGGIQIDSHFQNYAVAEEITVNLPSGNPATDYDHGVDFTRTYSEPPLIGVKLTKTLEGSDTCSTGSTHCSPYFAGFRGYRYTDGEYSGFYITYGMAGNEHGVQFTAYVIINANQLSELPSDSHGLIVKDENGLIVFHSGYKYFSYVGQMMFGVGDGFYQNPGPEPGEYGNWSAGDVTWDIPEYTDFAGWTYPEANFNNPRTPWEGWHNANAPAFTFESYGGYYWLVNGIDYTGTGTFGYGDSAGQTWHGSPWSPNYLSDHHVKTFNSWDFQHGGENDAIFIINEVTGYSNYRVNFALPSGSEIWANSYVFSSPILIRRADSKVSLQACISSMFEQHGAFYVSWLQIYLGAMQIGNINIPYGEVGE